MKVLFSVGKAYFPVYKEMIHQLTDLDFEVTHILEAECLDRNKIIENIQDASIYITSLAKADKEIIDAAPHLQYILKAGTGIDNIDLNYATEKGIPVSNVPGGNAQSVAELAIGMMLSLSREIPQLDRKTKNKEWEHSRGVEISKKKLGIIGLGAIGKAVATLARAFNMEITAFANYKDYDAAEKLGVHFIPLNQLLSESDYIVICTSLSQANYHINILVPATT